jgi:ParB family transcriptional regulator, chromosome partitioning protein
VSTAIERLKERGRPTVPLRNASLFTPPAAVIETAQPQTASVEQIVCSFTFTPDQKPLRHLYDPATLKDWGEHELKPNGIRSALWVRPHPTEPERWELVAGLRRYTAARLVGIDHVPIRVFDWTDEQAYEAAVAENKDRYGFTALEQLDSFLTILSARLNLEREEVVSLLYRMDNFAKGKLSTQSELGKDQVKAIEAVFAGADLTWRTFVANRLPLLKKPPEVLQAIRTGQIDFTKGLAIATVKDETQRQEFLDEAIHNQWSLEQTKQQVKASRPQPQESQAKGSQEMGDLSTRLSRVARRIKASRLDSSERKKLAALLEQVEQLLQ